MTNLHFRPVLLVMVATAFGSGTARAQSEADLSQVIRALAKVDATLDVEQVSVEKGTALAVGRHADTVYFVTAEHVISERATLASAVVARVPGCPTPLPVELHEDNVFSQWQIAFFSVQLPSSCRDQLSNIHFNLARGEIANLNAGDGDLAIKIIGRGANDEITPLGNSIVKSDGARLVFDHPTHEGTSGGVAVTERGELLCIVQNKEGGSVITNAALAANARDIPTTFLGPHAKVRIDGLPVHAQVSIDNQGVEPAKPMYHLLPRSHDVYVEAHGYQSASGRFSFGLDGLSLLCADLEQEIDPVWSLVRWPILGLGSALLITGVTFGALAIDAHSDFENSPSRAAYDRTGQYNTVADVTAIAGALALGTFAAGHLFWNASAESKIERCR